MQRSRLGLNQRGACANRELNAEIENQQRAIRRNTMGGREESDVKRKWLDDIRRNLRGQARGVWERRVRSGDAWRYKGEYIRIFDPRRERAGRIFGGKFFRGESQSLVSELDDIAGSIGGPTQDELKAAEKTIRREIAIKNQAKVLSNINSDTFASAAGENGLAALQQHYGVLVKAGFAGSGAQEGTIKDALKDRAEKVIGSNLGNVKKGTPLYNQIIKGITDRWYKGLGSTSSQNAFASALGSVGKTYRKYIDNDRVISVLSEQAQNGELQVGEKDIAAVMTAIGADRYADDARINAPQDQVYRRARRMHINGRYASLAGEGMAGATAIEIVARAGADPYAGRMLLRANTSYIPTLDAADANTYQNALTRATFLNENLEDPYARQAIKDTKKALEALDGLNLTKADIKDLRENGENATAFRKLAGSKEQKEKSLALIKAVKDVQLGGKSVDKYLTDKKLKISEIDTGKNAQGLLNIFKTANRDEAISYDILSTLKDILGLIQDFKGVQSVIAQ